MLAEANVSDDELIEYFGRSDGSATRVLMVFAFRLNQAMVLALARQDARPIAATLRELPRLPRHGQWATFLRNHDEVDLGRLTDEERQEVFAEFGADPDMQIYNRGIRRRLAPMLRQPAAHRTGLQPAAQHARNSGDPLRRGSRHGREPRCARARGHPNTDAVG